MNREHEERVKEFMERMKHDNPEEYDRVCEKYAVQTWARTRIIHNREIAVGLLGLSPSRISIPTAERYDLETLYKGDEKDQ